MPTKLIHGHRDKAASTTCGQNYVNNAHASTLTSIDKIILRNRQKLQTHAQTTKYNIKQCSNKMFTIETYTADISSSAKSSLTNRQALQTNKYLLQNQD